MGLDQSNVVLSGANCLRLIETKIDTEKGINLYFFREHSDK